MHKHASYERLIVLLLLFFVITLSSCGFKPSPAALASEIDKPLGTGATPEAGNDGKPAPRPDGHAQSIVAANGIVYIGSDNGTLYALNAKDGTVRWHQSLGSFVTVSAVMDGNVYVSTNNAVSAFAAISGARRWQHTINDIGGDGVYVGGTVILVDTAVSPGSGGDGPYSIYALRITDGSQLWHYTADSDTPGLLGVANGNVYAMDVAGSIPDPDEHVSALQTNNGHVLWRVDIQSTDGLVRGTPLEVNGIVYLITTSGAVYALQATTGTLIWHIARSETNGIAGDAMQPAIVNGVMYVDAEQGTYALRAADGTVLWEKKGTFFPLPFLIQPVVSNGRVYVAANGSIQALHVGDGSQIWQSSMISINGPLTIENGLIYINTPGKIYAFHEQDGLLAWQQSLDHHDTFSSSDTSMLVADGVVYASKDSGVVQALRASDGKSLWSYTIQEQAEPTDLAYSAIVTFASSVSYQQALKIIADLGLQVSVFCSSMWQPQVNGDIFSEHSLLVAATVNSAPLWLNRLQMTAGVQDAQAVGVHSCPMERSDDAFFRLHLKQSGTFVQVTFSPKISYNNALEAVSNLWFRMADPCYEQARAQGTKPIWHSQGQADTFATTHSLVLATTTLNSMHWLDQLHAVAGVMKVDAPLKMTCKS